MMCPVGCRHHARDLEQNLQMYIKPHMSGQGSAVVPAAIASPMAIGPPSLAPQAHNTGGNGNKSNTIVLIIVIIAIVVFLIFLFTKLNTQNKQIKELQIKDEQRQKTQDKRDKLLLAMAQQMGIRQNQNGELEYIQDADEDDEGECAGGACRVEEEDEKKDERQPEVFVSHGPPPAAFMNGLFAMPMFHHAAAVSAGAATGNRPAEPIAEVSVEETPVAAADQGQQAPASEPVVTIAAVD
jgi:hypothetical protein